jgi:IS5 family transposase
MQMSVGQGSLDDGLRPTWFGRDDRLELIRASIDWGAVGARLAGVHTSEEGRPAFPTVPMVRVLLLQRWTGASDQATARSLRSDLSHLSFTGLGMERRPPDASTICRFRNLLADAGLASEVFEEIASQLAGRGLALKTGSIVDSTIVETAVPARPGDRARGRSDHPEAPLCDPDAGTDRKGRLGFKAHITMDRGSQVVRRAKVVKANETDFTAGEAMIMGDEKEFYTDKGYSREALSRRLGSMGIKDRTMLRGNRHHGPPKRWGKRRNVLIRALRAPVESVFGTCKRSLGMRRARYTGHARVSAQIYLTMTVYNLLRMLKLTQKPARA